MIAALRPHLYAFLALLLLLTSTAVGAYVPLGVGNLILVLIIGTLKTAVIAIFFMELKREDTLIRLAALVGLFWLMIFLTLVLTDYLSRYPGGLLQ